MHGRLRSSEIGTRKIGGTSAVEKTSDGKSAVDDEFWFSEAARRLLPRKPGTALHYITGFEERICQRYAAGDVKPPSYFLRALMRSEQGWVWLAAAMDGCEAKWWKDLQKARRIAEAIDREE